MTQPAELNLGRYRHDFDLAREIKGTMDDVASSIERLHRQPNLETALIARAHIVQQLTLLDNVADRNLTLEDGTVFSREAFTQFQNEKFAAAFQQIAEQEARLAMAINPGLKVDPVVNYTPGPYRETALSLALFAYGNQAAKKHNITVQGAIATDDAAGAKLISNDEFAGIVADIAKYRAEAEAKLAEVVDAEKLTPEYAERAKGVIADKETVAVQRLQLLKEELEFNDHIAKAKAALQATKTEAAELAAKGDFEGAAARYDVGIAAANEARSALKGDQFKNLREVRYPGDLVLKIVSRKANELAGLIGHVGVDRAEMLVNGSRAVAAGEFNEQSVSRAESLIELVVSGDNARFLVTRPASPSHQRANAVTEAVIAGVDHLRDIRVNEKLRIETAAREEAALAEEAARNAAARATAYEAATKIVPDDNGLHAALRQFEETAAKGLEDLAKTIPEALAGERRALVSAQYDRDLGYEIRQALERAEKRRIEALTETAKLATATAASEQVRAEEIIQAAGRAILEIVGTDNAKLNRLQPVVERLRPNQGPTGGGNGGGNQPGPQDGGAGGQEATTAALAAVAAAAAGRDGSVPAVVRAEPAPAANDDRQPPAGAREAADANAGTRKKDSWTKRWGLTK